MYTQQLLMSSIWVKMVRTFFDCIRYRIRLEGFKSIRIRVRIFNTRYHIRIRILKSHIYDVDIQSYPIRHGSQYLESESGQKYENKYNISDIRSYPIRFHPYSHGRQPATLD